MGVVIGRGETVGVGVAVGIGEEVGIGVVEAEGEMAPEGVATGEARVSARTGTGPGSTPQRMTQPARRTDRKNGGDAFILKAVLR